MLMFRAWEIRTYRIDIEEDIEKFTPELSFKHFEKIALYTIKHIVQWIVLACVKLWYLLITKGKILIQNRLPKINKLLKKDSIGDPRKISFVQRAIIESKIKIKKVKEKIKKEHEEEIKNDENEVDKF